MTRKLLALVILLPALAAAQAAPPINPGTTDYLGDITASLLQFLNNYDALFLDLGQQLWRDIAIIMLVVYGIKWALTSAESIAEPAMHFLVLMLVSRAFLHYYAAPLPWCPYSVRQFFPQVGLELASRISLASTDSLYAALNTAVANTTDPNSIWQASQEITYHEIIFLTACMQAVIFIASSIGLVASSIFAVLGPLFIPWLMVSRLAFLFWNWLMAIVKYSFYQPVGAALSFIWSTGLMNFVNGRIHGDYSIAHWAQLIVPMSVLVIAMVASILLIGHYVNDLFSGGAMAGAGIASSAYSSISRATSSVAPRPMPHVVPKAA